MCLLWLAEHHILESTNNQRLICHWCYSPSAVDTSFFRRIIIHTIEHNTKIIPMNSAYIFTKLFSLLLFQMDLQKKNANSLISYVLHFFHIADYTNLSPNIFTKFESIFRWINTKRFYYVNKKNSGTLLLMLIFDKNRIKSLLKVREEFRDALGLNLNAFIQPNQTDNFLRDRIIWNGRWNFGML